MGVGVGVGVCECVWGWVGVGVYGGEQPPHLDNNFCDAKHYLVWSFSRERSQHYGALCKNFH